MKRIAAALLAGLLLACGPSIAQLIQSKQITPQSVVSTGNYPTHAALLAAVTGFVVNTLTQAGFTSSGDNGGATYNWNAASYCPGGTSGSPTTADGVTCILPSGQSPSTAGRYLIYLPGGILTSQMMGFVADGVTDNTPVMNEVLAFEAAGGSATGNGYDFKFGPGNFYFSQPIELHTQMILEGSTTGLSNLASVPTQLYFANNIAGIVLNQVFTCWAYGLSLTLCPNGTSSGSIVRNLYITPLNGRFAQTPLYPHAYGIWMRTVGIIENVTVFGFANDAIHIYCSTGNDPEIVGDCNGWIVRNVFLNGNYGTGLLVRGSDANAGHSEAVNTQFNGLFGIWDDSFLTNAHVAPESFVDGINLFGHPANGPSATAGVVSYGGQKYRLVQTHDSTGESTIWQNAQINPPTGTTSSNTWWTWVGASSPPDAFAPVWGQVVESNTVCTVIPGNESVMWVNDPLTSPSIWTCSGAPTLSTQAYINWTTASEMVNGTAPYVTYSGSLVHPGPYGPYVANGGYRDTESDSVWINPYLEGGIPNDAVSHFYQGIVAGDLVTTADSTPNGAPLALGSSSNAGLNNVRGAVIANTAFNAPAFILTNGSFQTTATSNSVSATCTVSNTCHVNGGRYTIGSTPNTVLVIAFTNASWPFSAPVCSAFDETTAAANPMRPSAVSQNSVTFTAASSFNAADKVSYFCMGI